MFTIQPHTTIDKDFVINGPDDFNMIIDYDDVDHELVDLMANTVVAILNRHWSVRELLEQAKNIKFHKLE